MNSIILMAKFLIMKAAVNYFIIRREYHAGKKQSLKPLQKHTKSPL